MSLIIAHRPQPHHKGLTNERGLGRAGPPAAGLPLKENPEPRLKINPGNPGGVRRAINSRDSTGGVVMCHHRLCRRPGLCNLQKQESRLTERGCQGGGEGTGGCPAIPFPEGAGTGYRLHGPQVSPVPRCVLSRGARAGSRRPPRMRSGPDSGGGCPPHGKRAGEERERRRRSKPQFWPEKNCGSSSQRGTAMALRGPVGDTRGRMAVPPGKEPCGSGQEPVRAQHNWAIPAAPGHLCMERTSCPLAVTCAWGNWGCGLGCGDTSAASGG